MAAVTSQDGTRIAFWRSGDGPPLLLVHGMIADHSTVWRSLAAELARHFTVFAMDRRGRAGAVMRPTTRCSGKPRMLQP